MLSLDHFKPRCAANRAVCELSAAMAARLRCRRASARALGERCATARARVCEGEVRSG